MLAAKTFLVMSQCITHRLGVPLALPDPLVMTRDLKLLPDQVDA